MIQVDSITIKEFRGIRDLTLNFNGKSFAICGPNGTGKSGVVDALEFVLTGNISRLSGEGRGEISLKQHAPHVDKRDNPGHALVSAKLTIPSLKKSVTIERSVKTPGTLKVTPSDTEIAKVLSHVEAHPEVVLSRRELIRYVLATPGKRNEEVQALLHLDQIEQVRANLQKIANSTDKQLKALELPLNAARDNLMRALSIAELSAENILSSANKQRGILELPNIVELAATTSLKDGLTAQAQRKSQSIAKSQALSDITAVREILDEMSGEPTKAKIKPIIEDASSLANDPTLASGVTKENFYRVGLSVIETEACPFCETEWDIATLKSRAETKLRNLAEIAGRRKALEGKIKPLTELLRKAGAAINVLARYSAATTLPVDMEAAVKFAASCQSVTRTLEAFLPITKTVDTLKMLSDVPPDVGEAISSLEKTIAALPDPSKQDAARDILTISQERLEVWREAKRNLKSTQVKALLARRIFETYGKTSDRVLTELYATVQNDFSALYKAINHTDEKSFTAKLVPSLGKLGFDVNFYDRGFFPPGAYHSEGHQDGMGLCLYLALMRHLHGKGFTFAVLDDVLMSVDAGHRREVCGLLKREFPNTQFVMTTHDPIWMRHMKTEGLISGRGAVQFRAWDVNQGPTQWDDRDVWKEADDYLQKNDVRSARVQRQLFFTISDN
ncbi:MAG TPA: AAA family ATPase [Verrucomicrobiae bacterium]|jgi:recombinational DNA repair ATPase RecF